jgi:hypothetical protein
MTGKTESRSGTAICGAAAAAILLLAGPVRVDAEGGPAVPFAAALSGTAVLDLGRAEARCSSEGIATHLGLTTSECTAALDLANYRPYDECAGEGTGFGLPNVNTLRLTAANGDRLVLVSIDLACELVQLTSFHGTGVWTVDGAASTGRFANATGTGNLDGTVDFFAGTVQVSLTGEIAY